MDQTLPLTALALTCSLKPSPSKSSADLMASQILDELGAFNVQTELVRVVDHDIKPGVETDMDNGDAWPELRQKMLAADILLMVTPIWMGHMSSIAQRVVERLDAELAETDDQGRLKTNGKVAIVGVVGNEDGAHKVCADLFQALNDVGFTLPAGAASYWVGEAMGSTDYNDLESTPEKVTKLNKSVAANAVHLAMLLKQVAYPPSD